MKCDFLLASVSRGNEYERIVVRQNAVTMASLLVMNKTAPEIVFSTENDEVFLLAFENYVDSCIDSQFLNKKLLPALDLINMGELEPIDIEPLPDELLKRFSLF